MVEWLPWGTTRNITYTATPALTFITQSSTCSKGSWHSKCSCCMTMPVHTPAIKQPWHPLGLQSYHSFHIHLTWPCQIMPCWTSWRGHCMVDSSQTIITSRVVSANQGLLSGKTGVLQPSGRHQKDSNGVLTLVGSMWSVLWCDSVTVIMWVQIFLEWLSHKEMHVN
jgi:hypothetical protein